MITQKKIKSKSLSINSISSLKSAVEEISDYAKQHQYMISNRRCLIVYLMGELGVGKTTFAQHWLRYIGIRGAIPSPTYAIMNEYEHKGMHFVHADLYRISDPEELVYLDVREWSDRSSLILIEWPENGGDYLPAADICCHFTLENNQRKLLWQTTTSFDEK